MKTGRRDKPKKRIPPWLMGLIFAVIVSVVALLVLDAMGYGDDPSVGTFESLSFPSGGTTWR